MGRRKLDPTILGRLDKTPPFLVFALARKGRGRGVKRPTFHELASASGLSDRTFARIANKLSWAGVKVADVDAFVKGCNVNLFHLWAQALYIRRMAQGGKFRHLNPQQQRSFEAKFLAWEKMKTANPSA